MLGSVVMLTALKLSGGESLGSLNPKSDDAKVYVPLLSVFTVVSVPTGVIDMAEIETVAVLLSKMPSLTLYVNESEPA